MRQTKKITLSAILVALGVAFMALGAVFEVLDLSVCALVSLLVVFVYLEIGSPYTWLVWICTSLISALIFPGSILWVEYSLVFGIYPIIKGYIERVPSRILWWILKLAFFNAVIWALFSVVEFVIGVRFFDGDSLIWNAAIYLLMNFAFIVYDLFITAMVRVYYERFRKRFVRFLK